MSETQDQEAFPISEPLRVIETNDLSPEPSLRDFESMLHAIIGEKKSSGRWQNSTASIIPGIVIIGEPFSEAFTLPDSILGRDNHSLQRTSFDVKQHLVAADGGIQGSNYSSAVVRAAGSHPSAFMDTLFLVRGARVVEGAQPVDWSELCHKYRFKGKSGSRDVWYLPQGRYEVSPVSDHYGLITFNAQVKEGMGEDESSCDVVDGRTYHFPKAYGFTVSQKPITVVLAYEEKSYFAMGGATPAQPTPAETRSSWSSKKTRAL